MKTHHIYRGVNITRTDRMSRAWVNGFRWEALVPGGGFKYAETLKGIKALIRDALT